MTSNSVLLIDDHTLFRAGLAMLLASHPLLDELLEAGSIAEARRIERDDVALIMLDVCLPGLNGLEGICLLRKQFPKARVLVLSGNDDFNWRTQARDKGADGFLSKAADAEQIAAAIDRLLSGEQSWDESSASVLGQPALSLTSRQTEVLGLLCEGKSNKAIARELDMAENTVRVHVSAILASLGVSSRTEAAVAARQQGIVR
ncbi:DNA-binding response regulator [Pseudomonas sp. 9AZ]|uniref:response regulator n=1 Tax=Pseudomonas sp. 9AZ TaxID=2653168 RepID=UPI0012F23D52|nr:response regulator transcription factor [Pseudomonas sp. 9AZ]VXD00278.1 DNA-binding response regulator [Pseudomonas sp. 9AZ]